MSSTPPTDIQDRNNNDDLILIILPAQTTNPTLLYETYEHGPGRKCKSSVYKHHIITAGKQYCLMVKPWINGNLFRQAAPSDTSGAISSQCFESFETYQSRYLLELHHYLAVYPPLSKLVQDVQAFGLLFTKHISNERSQSLTTLHLLAPIIFADINQDFTIWSASTTVEHGKSDHFKSLLFDLNQKKNHFSPIFFPDCDTTKTPFMNEIQPAEEAAHIGLTVYITTFTGEVGLDSEGFNPSIWHLKWLLTIWIKGTITFGVISMGLATQGHCYKPTVTPYKALARFSHSGSAGLQSHSWRHVLLQLMAHPLFQITELLYLIITHLNRNDQVSCTAICKEWSEVALDIIWAQVDPDDVPAFTNLFTPVKKIVKVAGDRSYTFDSPPSPESFICFKSKYYLDCALEQILKVVRVWGLHFLIWVLGLEPGVPALFSGLDIDAADPHTETFSWVVQYCAEGFLSVKDCNDINILSLFLFFFPVLLSSSDSPVSPGINPFVFTSNKFET
ncbi:hypothetical protein D9758_008767 [Tetrapyrgos nigripes]|uniref:F-box domain-containing protein n=1 Tax=Tetrapyrgos nigripes TaxID=182062 RepID=A0A8H5FX74_9AGAR|nr:hypothetical protein D9758_008767 [Tetrapyrgos nigripes]